VGQVSGCQTLLPQLYDGDDSDEMTRAVTWIRETCVCLSQLSHSVSRSKKGHRSAIHAAWYRLALRFLQSTTASVTWPLPTLSCCTIHARIFSSTHPAQDHRKGVAGLQQGLSACLNEQIKGAGLSHILWGFTDLRMFVMDRSEA
jgi:hypothetical protein